MYTRDLAEKIIMDLDSAVLELEEANRWQPDMLRENKHILDRALKSFAEIMEGL